MAITQRSGKEVQVRKEVERKHNDDEAEKIRSKSRRQWKKKNITELTDESEQLKVQTEISTDDTMQKKTGEVKSYQPSIPFPRRLKQSKLDDQFAKFLNIFKKPKINIPSVEALTQMPHYAKFMKEIINKKRKLDENGVVSLFASYSAIIKKKLP